MSFWWHNKLSIFLQQQKTLNCFNKRPQTVRMNFSICISIHKINALDQNFGCLVNMLNCIDEALGVRFWRLSLVLDFDAWFWRLIMTLDYDAWLWRLIMTLDFDAWFWH